MKITSLEILTSDLDAARDFYHGLLQLKILSVTESHISFQLQGSILEFVLNKSSAAIYHIAFNIPCNQIREAHEWLKNKVEIIPVDNKNIIADFSNWNAEAVYFYDHQNNIIEFIARRDLNNGSANEFTQASILAISEVGIVTENVTAEIRELKEIYSIDFFEKQPPMKNFAALGDDEGLFIVVSNNRPWYPTTIVSSIHWMKVNFIQGDHSFTLELPSQNV